MGLVVFPLADAIASLFLFDAAGVGQPPRHPLPHPPSLVAANSASIAEARLYRSQPGVIGDDEPLAASPAVDSRQGDVWNLPNGRVQFDRPLSFPGINVQNGEPRSGSSSSSVALWNPTFLGSGGSGAVFSFSTQKDGHDATIGAARIGNDDRVAVKVSWKRSRASVENECSILHRLEGVPHVERCLGRPVPYPYEDGRVMIALSPVIASDTSEITSRLDNVKAGQPQRTAVKDVVETMVGMLRAGVFTIDVQPLISAETGDALFIDFTEAKHFSDPPTPSDEAALLGFSAEMLALVGESLRDVAAEYLTSELKALNNNDVQLPEKVVDILESTWLD